MIDYLERLFALETRGETEKPEINFRFSPSQELPEEMSRPVLSAGETAAMPVPSPEEYWQEEGVRRLERALSDVPALPRRLDSVPPEELPGVYMAGEEPLFGGRGGLSISRPRGQGAGEELERRLRRDSRRYDSGFFWY